MLGRLSRFWMELGVVLLTLLIIVLGEWLGLVQPLASVLERSLQPIVIVTNELTINTKQPASFFKKSFGAAERVQQLEKDYTQSLAKIAELEYLAEENNELRRLLNTKEKNQKIAIAAPIVSHGQPSISVGEADDVQVGQPVLVAEMLVGLIKETSNYQSTVNLLFQNSTTPILVETESGVEGLMIGNGKNILLTEIPKEANIEVGEKVMTLGQEQIKPQLFVGQIQQIIDRPSSPIKEAIISQETSFYEASIVEVLP